MSLTQASGPRTGRIAISALAASVTMIVTNELQAATWTGGGVDDEYSTAANWDDGLVPASGSTQDINGAFIVERSVDSVAGRTFVRGDGVLNVTGGVHNDSRSGASIYNFFGDGSKGTVNHTGGDYLIGHGLRIGTGDSVNSDGLYALSGGALVVYRGSNSAIEPSNPGGRPSIEIGAALNGVGLLDVTGGSLETRAGVHIGATGTFRVEGSDPTSIGIGSNSSGDGVWLQKTGGTLSAAIDAGGVTPVFVDDVGGGAIFVEFESGSVLDLSFDGIAPVAGSWTILEAENTAIDDQGLGLSGTTDAGWSFTVDNSGANGLLIATYVIPEPASTSLVALIGGIFALRRRRLA